MFKDVHAQDDIEALVNVEREKIAIEHRVAYIRIGKRKGEMTHLRSEDFDPCICQKTDHRTSKASEFEATFRAKTTHYCRGDLLIEINHRRPNAEPVVVAMPVDKGRHQADVGGTASNINHDVAKAGVLHFVVAGH